MVSLTEDSHVTLGLGGSAFFVLKGCVLSVWYSQVFTCDASCPNDECDVPEVNNVFQCCLYDMYIYNILFQPVSSISVDTVP